MKNSELKKLISQYKEIINKQKKKYVNNVKLEEIEINIKIISETFLYLFRHLNL